MPPAEDTVKRCAGCGYTHSYCTSQTQVEDLLHQLYGAVNAETNSDGSCCVRSAGITSAIESVEEYLS